MPETVNQETPAVTTAPSPTLCTLQAIAASMEALNGRVSNIEDKFDKLLDLVASVVAQLAGAIEHDASAETPLAVTPQHRYQATYEPRTLPANRVAVQATAICKGFDSRSNKPTLSVLCGEWNKFGVAVYPEVMPRLGFDNFDALPMGTLAWDRDVIVELREDGKPKKVIGLAS